MESIWIKAERVYCTLLLIGNAIFIWRRIKLDSSAVGICDKLTHVFTILRLLFTIHWKIYFLFSFFAHSVICYVIVMLQLFRHTTIEMASVTFCHYFIIASISTFFSPWDFRFNFNLILFHIFDSISLMIMDIHCISITEYTTLLPNRNYFVFVYVYVLKKINLHWSHSDSFQRKNTGRILNECE